MNWTKVLWVTGVAVIASVIDLIYMFWSRSGAGGTYAKAGWKAAGFGSGSYNLVKMGKPFYNKGGYHK